MPHERELDEAAVRQWQARDPGGFDRLVAQFAPEVTRLAHRLLGWPHDPADVEDTVQDVFLTLLRNPAAFDGRSAFRTWLTRVTVNHCLSLRRRWRSRQRRLWDWLARQHHTAGESPEVAAQRGEQADGVWAALARLRPADRAILVLHYLEHLPVADVAVALGIAKNAAEARLSRARARLREQLPAEQEHVN
ncbi:MAG: sigma-70 family RNA polymerase sigma factor [Gemmataceae bacterium]|nr:sigma-70 family RNA polymerase sigma factor [Gemmataceae bacterium]